MNKLIMILLAFTMNVFALTPEAEKGKATIAVCMSCHNPELNPALAPPFYGVQNKYKQAHDNQESFVQAISDWAKHPTLEKALMNRPVKMLGLMPAMPLPDDMLKSIATYLYEENFEPPCTHWAIDLAKIDSGSSSEQSKGMGKGKGAGNGKGSGGNHDAMIRMKYNQLCKGK